MAAEKQSQVPEYFQQYFWDCDIGNLSIKEHAAFIAERLLTFGDMDCMRWILRNYDKKWLRDLARNSRRLDRKTRYFWTLILE